jgi:hypothetical protein
MHGVWRVCVEYVEFTEMNDSSLHNFETVKRPPSSREFNEVMNWSFRWEKLVHLMLFMINLLLANKSNSDLRANGFVFGL